MEEIEDKPITLTEIFELHRKELSEAFGRVLDVICGKADQVCPYYDNISETEDSNNEYTWVINEKS